MMWPLFFVRNVGNLRSIKDGRERKMKEKKCIFCDWQRLYHERERYDWDYVCEECKIKGGFVIKHKDKGSRIAMERFKYL